MVTGHWLFILFLCRLAAGALTTKEVTLTNANGQLITQYTVATVGAEAATTVITTTNAAGVVTAVTTTGAGATTTGTGTVTTGTGKTTTGTGTTTTGTGTATTGTGTTTTGTGTTTTGTGTTTTGTGTTTTGTGTTTTGTGTTTPGVLATTTSSSSVSSSVSASSSGSIAATGSTTNTNVAAGTRPDPSTDFTEAPVTAASLSRDSLVTLTLGTTKTITSTRPLTSNLWVTVVRSGHTVTVQTTFAQSFSSQYSSVASPASGSIGLGSESGTVGVVRSDMQLTIPLGGAGTQSAKRLLPFVSLFTFLIYLL